MLYLEFDRPFFKDMNSQLNNDLIAIALKRNELGRLSYASPEYDSVEEELHEMEDSFDEIHGKYLHEVFAGVYSKISSENEIMLCIAYIAKKYNIVQDEETLENGFEPPLGEGIQVESLGYKNEILQLVLAPNPLRILLQEGRNKRNVIWEDK